MEPQAARRTRGPRAGEPWRLLGTDLVVVAVIWTVAGSAWWATLLGTGLTVLAVAAAGLYRQRLHLSALDDVPRLLLSAGAVTALAAWLALPALMVPPALAALPALLPALVVAATMAARATTYRRLYRRRRRVAGERAIILGSGDLAIGLAEVLGADRAYGITPIGLVGPPTLTATALPVPLLGPTGELARIATDHRPDSVIVAFPSAPDAELVGLVRRWRRHGIGVYVVPRLFELSVPAGRAEQVHGIPLERIRPEPMRHVRAAAKRTIDVVGAAIGLALASPVLAACALAVRLESGHAGVLFRQQRVGRDGKPFTMLKFRSMTPSSDRESQVRWSIDHDDRVGPVGRILRSTSLDELPQLVNVLRGEMSLVGPRPERPFFAEQFARTYGGYADRHRVPVGMTGWAQIHGLRGDTSIAHRVRLDNHYIENWSIGLDIKIMIRTVGWMLGLSRRWR
ncbi:sugar transferase [Phytohabitans rumicis]|uniref:UDP-phosphate galactose phosphotransferase n=1 Tax=Phytohabitans rumicis TaxID=1076125 RepID=A0A6V8KPZ6_9ACTN|nr:sugar transferase [Phytohabitans rumicis]GFJ87242.1 UDP-phosphate galactose phosphotransferase [Phytohabitans rumicis]